MIDAAAKRLLAAIGGSYAARVVLLAVAYAAVAVLSRGISLPPAAAAPIWPPAGLALAALVIGGIRLWPGILLGYLFVSVFANDMVTDGLYAQLPLAMLGSALLFSLGPTAQAVIGARLAGGPRRGLAPGRDRNVFRALLYAGPVSCTVAATWGVLLLWQQGAVSAGQLPAEWLLWWFGDSVGVLLFAPLVALLTPTGSRLWRGRRWQVAMPLLGASALLLPAVYLFHDAEEAEARRPLLVEAEHAFDVTRQRLDAATRAVEVTASLFSSSQVVTEAEFSNFARRVRSEGIIAIGWIPRVTHDRRAAFVAAARQSGIEGYDILERSSGGGYVVAPVRAEYYPIQYLESPDENMRPSGFDISSEPARVATLARARDTGLPAASEPVPMRIGGADGIVLLVPVFAQGVDAATLDVAGRRDAVVGFVGGVIDPAFIGQSLNTAAGSGKLAFDINDTTPNEQRRDLADIGTIDADGSQQLWSREFDFHGRRWQIVAAAGAGYWLPAKSAKSRAFLLAALLGAFLISLQTLVFATRDRAVGLKVAARTRELAHSRRRLRNALNLARIACWEIDIRTGTIQLDEQSMAVLKTSAAAEGGTQMPVQDWIREFVHPDDARDVTAAFMLALSEKPSVRNAPREFRVTTRTGEVRHLLMHFDVDTDADGMATRVLGNSQDITDRKEAELALRQSEEYSRSILESSSDSIKILSLDGRLLDMNPRGCELFGIDDFDMVRGLDWRSFWKRETHYQAACEAVTTASAGGTARFTGFTPTMDGTPKWWDVVVSPIPGEDGKPVSLLAVTRDVTEQHEAREEIRRMNAGLEEEIERRNVELAASERELRAIFDVAAVGIAHIALDGRVLRVNPKIAEIIGFAEEEILDSRDFNRTHRDDRAHEERLVEDLLAGNIDTYVLEKRFFRRDDTMIWLRVTGSLVRDESGEPVYRVAIVEDISEARAESELRIGSERRYRELFDRNPMPMWTYDADTLQFLSVNDAAIEHYGYSREQFMDMTLRDIRPADSQQQLDELLAQRSNGFQPPHVVQHQRADGAVVTVEITAHDIINEGRPARLVLANDVTERDRASTLLEGQKNVLEEITFGTHLADSLDSLARLAEQGSPGALCSILVTDRKSGALRHAAAPSLSDAFTTTIDARSADGHGFFADIVDCVDATVVDDIQTDPRWATLRDVAHDHALHSCWTTPILDAAGSILGVFVLYYEEQRKPTPLDGDLVETLTNTAAIAIGKDRETRRLEESQERFRSTFETAALGILHVGLDGKFTLANPSVCRIIGYSAEEMLELDADTLSHPDDVHLGQEDRARMFAGEIPSYTVEKRYLRKDGSVVWLAVTISTVKNADGDVQYAVALIDDISWRKQAESELHRQQEINRLLLENLSEGVVACDADGQLMLFNKAAREWHGADPREIPPEKWSDYYDLYQGDGETPLAIDDIPLMRAFNGERVKGVEMSIVRKGHPPRIVLASGAPLLDADGCKRGAVVVMHDVTMRRQSLLKLERAADKLKAANAQIEEERASLAERVAERTAALTAANAQLEKAKEIAEGASRAKSAFLAVMSHEIRTPMNGILGMVDVLSQSSLGDDQQDAVQTIRDSSFSLLRLIDDILDFSKVEAGRLELEQTVISLPEVVESVCDSLSADALKKEVDLRLFVDPDVPERVVSDPTRLRQLLYNLVGNAIKFSGGRQTIRGRVQVYVEPAGDSLQFRIMDNGVGIAADALPHLFDSFTQAEVSTTRRFGGTGLGLAITKRLVELMHGDIEVQSEVGAGSEFRVRLPLEPVTHGRAVREFDLSGLHCAIIRGTDDDEESRVAYLDPAGRHVAVVADAEAARAAADNTVEPLIVVSELPGDSPDDDTIIEQTQRHANQINIVLTRGPRVSARIIAPHLVVLQSQALRRRDFVRAIAVAAGRASPEVARAAESELVRGQLVAPSVAQARLDGRLILVAEDDPINQKVILRQLSLLGYAGELAGNGAEALQMWRDDSYALLLTDLHMPEMDGYELARNVRAAETNGERLPILALTANALRGEAERARAAGFDAYLTKPLQLSVLSSALEEWLPGARCEQRDDYARAATSASDAAPAVDLDVLRAVIGDDEAVIHEFLREYLHSSAGQVDDLRAAAAGGDSDRLARRAHRHKGAARAIGAGRLGDLCAELENAARAEDPAHTPRLLAQLEEQAAAVAADIRRIVSGDAAAGERTSSRGRQSAESSRGSAL